MLQSFILLLLFIGIFRFVMRFVLPIARVGSAVHRQMKNMQQAGSTEAPQQANGKQKPARRAKVGDYIDFEEVK